jgi:glutamate synthase domain-containing protein 2
MIVDSPISVRKIFYALAAAYAASVVVVAPFYGAYAWSLIIGIPLIALGFRDLQQRKSTILRNFPVIGHLRFLLEEIRPEMYQYFVESDTSGTPFNRLERSLVYQRAKNVRDTVPFGTQSNVYEVGYEWVNHSLQPVHLEQHDLRVNVGGSECTQPYSASLLNVSAMSFGSLSRNAVIALNGGAKMGGFAHNTGEGGISKYHLEGGGDLIWQIGTGYFGCRHDDGTFNPEKFKQKATLPNIKMIEIKLSQGAKPGHGGILPAAKLTPEIAEMREVPMGKAVLSPPAHSRFSTPLELVQFIQQLRDLSGGKPVGFKLCVGKRREFIAICKAMLQTGIKPDFITVDGGEGGTGAAPLEFTNNIGTPLCEGLIFVHNVLNGFDLRKDIRIISSGKAISGFGIVKRLALGADMCYSARGMMMALGCIQALKCNTNRCPVGVATQDETLMDGLDPADKKVRVFHFHHNLEKSVCEIIGAMGLQDPSELEPWHLMRRVSPTEVKHYGEIYDYLQPGSLLSDTLPPSYARAVTAAQASSFAALPN